MKIEHIIYDIKELLLALKDDTRIKDSYLIHKINNYYSLLTEMDYAQGLSIPEQHFSRLPKRSVKQINSADHPDIVHSSIKMGKVELPKLMSLPDNAGLRIMATSRQQEVFPAQFANLMHMIRAGDFRLRLYYYYSLYGNDLYVYPYLPEVDILAMLADPTEAFSVKTQLYELGEMTNGTEYTVMQGAANEDTGSGTNNYTKYEDFTCNTDYTYTGDAKVQEKDAITQLTLLDEYPITPSMAQRIVMEILTKDYQIERQSIEDVYNDARDEELLRRLKIR